MAIQIVELGESSSRSPNIFHPPKETKTKERVERLDQKFTNLMFVVAFSYCLPSWKTLILMKIDFWTVPFIVIG